MSDQLAKLHRIERAVQRFFGRRELVDQHELAASLWDEDADMALSLIRLRCISAARRAEKELELGALRITGVTPPIADARELVNHLCAGLEPSHRHLLYLRYWKGLGIEAIALELNRQPKAIRASLRWILHQLAQKHSYEGAHHAVEGRTI